MLWKPRMTFVDGLLPGQLEESEHRAIGFYFSIVLVSALLLWSFYCAGVLPGFWFSFENSFALRYVMRGCLRRCWLVIALPEQELLLSRFVVSPRLKELAYSAPGSVRLLEWRELTMASRRLTSPKSIELVLFADDPAKIGLHLDLQRLETVLAECPCNQQQHQMGLALLLSAKALAVSGTLLACTASTAAAPHALLLSLRQARQNWPSIVFEHFSSTAPASACWWSSSIHLSYNSSFPSVTGWSELECPASLLQQQTSSFSSDGPADSSLLHGVAADCFGLLVSFWLFLGARDWFGWRFFIFLVLLLGFWCILSFSHICSGLASTWFRPQPSCRCAWHSGNLPSLSIHNSFLYPTPKLQLPTSLCSICRDHRKPPPSWSVSNPCWLCSYSPHTATSRSSSCHSAATAPCSLVRLSRQSSWTWISADEHF